MGHGQPWTALDDEIIKKNISTMSYREIGNLIGRTRGAVEFHILNYLKIGKRPRHTPSAWNDQNVSKLKEMWIAGDSATTIARALGSSFTKGMIVGKVYRMKLPHHVRKTLSKEELRARGVARNRRYRERLRLLGIKRNRENERRKRYVPPVVERPDSLNIPFRDTGKHHCRYMAGDDRLCCGHETIEGLSWCGFHYGVVYRDDRRSTAVAGFNKQSMAYSQGAKHPKSEVQTMDRRGQTSLAPTEGPQNNRPNPG